MALHMQGNLSIGLILSVGLILRLTSLVLTEEWLAAKSG